MQLGIPEPDVNLEVGSGTQAEQTAAIMTRYERLLLDAPSRLCLVVGDVTSTMACTIAARKLCIPVAHVEGGIRSGDWSMPEEINRMLTDSITNWFFTTSEFANANLRRAGVEEERIFFVGNTMIDTLLANLDRLRPPAFWDELDLRPGEYLVMTLHRPANVDQAETLQRMLAAIEAGTRGLPVLFPVHPRTAKVIAETLGKHALSSFRAGSRNPAPGTARLRLTTSAGVVREFAIHGLDPGIPAGMTAKWVLPCVLTYTGQKDRWRSICAIRYWSTKRRPLMNVAL